MVRLQAADVSKSKDNLSSTVTGFLGHTRITAMCFTYRFVTYNIERAIAPYGTPVLGSATYGGSKRIRVAR